MFLLVEKRFNCLVFFHVVHRTEWFLVSDCHARRNGRCPVNETAGKSAEKEKEKAVSYEPSNFVSYFPFHFAGNLRRRSCYCLPRWIVLAASTVRIVLGQFTDIGMAGYFHLQWRGQRRVTPAYGRPSIGIGMPSEAKDDGVLLMATSLGTRQVAFHYNATMPCWTV